MEGDNREINMDNMSDSSHDSVREVGQINTVMGLGTTKNCAEGHQKITRQLVMGPESKNHGADGGRQQFTTPGESEPTVVSQKNMSGSEEFQNNGLGEDQQKIASSE
jgi:hypothetical protein